MNDQIRWHQRLSQFQKALQKLSDGVLLSQQKKLVSIEQQGLIKAFEFTLELSWNLLKDYFADQGNFEITGSKDAFREGFQKGLLQNGSQWMEMIKSRNQTSHTYNEEIADEISLKILNSYFSLFKSLETKMLSLKNGK